MKTNQELTPKYWVAHSRVNSDVVLGTMSKSYQEVVDKMNVIDPDWCDREMLQGGVIYEVILVEVKEVLCQQ